MIGIFGTSDVENYGDLLYPLVFDHLLRRCGSAAATRAYAFLPGPAPAAAGYSTHAIADLLRAPGRLVDALWIGGGDILRTDTRTIASHYVEQFASRPECHLFLRLRRWISGDRVLAKAFISTFIRYACAGPMLLDATRASAMIAHA